jgi:hypothetical protein
MKNIFLLLCGIFFLSSCVQSTNTTSLRNGKIDPVEMATLQLAIGVAMNQKPSAVKPAYLVTNELLKITEKNQVLLDNSDSIINTEIDKLSLDLMTKQSAKDLSNLIKQIVIQMLDSEGISKDQRYIAIIDIIKIVNQSAKSRLDYVTYTREIEIREINQ